ncbi:MAG: hypothetical protein WCP21_14545 [Armatimonadota bacterium]
MRIRPLESFVKQARYFGGVKAEAEAQSRGFFEAMADRGAGLRRPSSGGTFRHEGTAALARVEEPFGLQFAIHSTNGIGIDEHLVRQFAESGELVARLQRAGGDGQA